MGLLVKSTNVMPILTTSREIVSVVNKLGRFLKISYINDLIWFQYPILIEFWICFLIVLIKFYK